MLNDKHPEYLDNYADWELMEESRRGEKSIKDRGTTRLPKTSGQIEAEAMAKAEDSELNLTEAQDIYNAYRERAEYPHWVKDSHRTMMGLMSRQDAEIKLPTRMNDLLDEATADGFGLEQLFLRVVSELLYTGRNPLLADFDDSGKPYIASYSAISAINWKEKSSGGRRDLSLSVFLENNPKESNDEFSHDTEEQFRVLDLEEGKYRVRLMQGNGVVLEEKTPGLLAGEEVKRLEFIPVVYVGSTDNSVEVDEIPLLSMAKAALKYYQISADYFTALHYTAHPQPVVIGLDDDKSLRVTGPMAAWILPKDGDAKYLEFEGSGIEATRNAMVDQRNAAAESGARVLNTGSPESGESRKVRQDDQHSSLYSVVTSASEGIEQVLRYLATWMGENPDEVVFNVQPKFTAEEIDSALVNIIGNLVMAGKLPDAVLYESLRKNGVTSLTDDQIEKLLLGVRREDLEE